MNKYQSTLGIFSLCFVFLIISVFIAGCSSKKEEKSSAIEVGDVESVASVNRDGMGKPAEEVESTGPEGSQSSEGADVLLGIWEVVKAEGQHADANKGLVYDFKKGGRVIVHGFEVRRDARAMEMTIDGKRMPKITEWNWKRTGPETIDMSYGDMPTSAQITHRMEGDLLNFKWNQGGQVFTMKRLEKLSDRADDYLQR